MNFYVLLFTVIWKQIKDFMVLNHLRGNLKQNYVQTMHMWLLKYKLLLKYKTEERAEEGMIKWAKNLGYSIQMEGWENMGLKFTLL